MGTKLYKDKIEYSKSLLTAAMIFNTIVLAANFAGQKPLVIFHLIVSAGSALFPLTYLVSVLITEIYGRESAKHIIRLGLICNVLVAIFIHQTIQFPYPEFWDKQPYYEIVMQQMWQILIFSSFAYILSEYTNLYVFTYLTRIWKGNNFRFRVFCSTLCAVIIDTLFLIPIMIKSSPAYDVVIYKVVSLIIFKSCFVFTGLFFISAVRDLILRKELNAKMADAFSCKIIESIDNADPKNVFWFKNNKKVR